MLRTWTSPLLSSIKASGSIRLPSLASSSPNGVKTPTPAAIRSLRPTIQTRFRHHIFRKYKYQLNQFQHQQQQNAYNPGNPGHLPHIPHVRLLSPTIWALVVSGGIYTGLAFLEAKREIKERLARTLQTWAPVPDWGVPRTPPSVLKSNIAIDFWNALDPMRKLSTSIIASCLLVQGSSFVVPQFWRLLWHMPARNANYTLFTSTFVHSGGLHLFFNMYVLHNFIRPIGYSSVFDGKACHALSFFLAAGTLSGLAQHYASLIPSRMGVNPALVSGGGASGALFAFLAIFCTQYPDNKLGLFFIPVYFQAPYVLSGLMLFDFVGMVRGGFASFPLGHAAHLSGAFLGIGYAYFNGKQRVWNPLVDFWKRRLEPSGGSDGEKTSSLD